MMLIRTNPQVTYRPRNSCNSLLCEVRPFSCSTSWHMDIYSQTECATEFMESLTRHWPCSHSLLQNGAGIPRMVQRPAEIPRRNTDAGSSPLCGKGFFSLGQHSVQALLRCPCSPRAESHALTMCCLMSSDVSWHIRDKLWPMPKHGSVVLYGHLDSHTTPELWRKH